jgi:hypothetical protein
VDWRAGGVSFLLFGLLFVDSCLLIEERKEDATTNNKRKIGTKQKAAESQIRRLFHIPGDQRLQWLTA